MNARPGTDRLVQIDALRGVAAMAVVLFHLSTRFAELYHPAVAPSLAFPLGHYGVNLFFMISGFVIFMTLQRTRQSMDFVVSRFSRLYPAYWAAVALTFAITHGLGLPGREAGTGTALLNLLMFHNLFGVPHVDGAYWTLEVELLFYCGMLLLFRSGRLHQVHVWMLGLLGLRWIYFIAETVFGFSLPWIIHRLLILKFLPWFALGIGVHALAGLHGTNRPRPVVLASMALALLSLFLTDSVFLGLLTTVMLLVLYGAATGRLRPLAWAPLAWLGSISYPLYLLHEYIGWACMLMLLRLGFGIDVAALAALAMILLLSHVVSRTVELPVMAWIRRRWRNRAASAAQ